MTTTTSHNKEGSDKWQPLDNENDNEDGDDNDMERGDLQHQTNCILVEIVSALSVPSMDSGKPESDPFVDVYMGGVRLHRTSVIPNSRNPIWTLYTQSLFLIDLSTAKDDNDKELDTNSATVQFVVKDHDTMNREDIIGEVVVKLKNMIKGKGKRKSFSMDLSPDVLEFNKKRKRFVSKRAKLVLRYKPATLEDVQFIQLLDTKHYGICAAETFLPPTSSTVKSTQTDVALPQITGWGAKLLATQDPDEKDNILEQALQPSEEWIDVGSGPVGRVYLEVIGCNDLPNMDSPTLRNLNNMTDAYCCMVLEDSIVNTSVVNDTLSPRWLPNDRRAFIFHMHHPSSQLYLSVFDHDKVNRVGNTMRQRVHDPIGRVLVNLSQFHTGTMYTLHYHLFLVDRDEEKHREEQTHNGTIIIRLRIEWGGDEATKRCHQKGRNDTTNMLLDGLSVPPPVHVAVPTKHDFHVAHYTTVGKHDPNRFNMQQLTSYVTEIQTYYDEDVMMILADSAMTLLLWRGHYGISCCGKSIDLPLHSMVAFAWGVLVTQNYNRFPSFLLFMIGWFFLATNEYRRSHPSPWHKCKSFGGLLRSLLAGTFCGCCGSRGVDGGITIEENENLPAIQAYYEAVRDRREEQDKQKKKAVEHAAQMENEDLQKQMEIDADGMDDTVNIAGMGPKGSFMASMNPLKPFLFPIQKFLYQVCWYLRIGKSILTWEEAYFPFWITTFSFLGCLLFFVVPWGFLLRWVFRIVVWVVLGPWMKLVDWMYFDKMDNMPADERKKLLQKEMQDNYQQTLAERMQSHKRKEDMMKLKSMLKYLFGKYLLRVPRGREARFLDYPLPSSTAEPLHTRTSDAELNIVGQICGQELKGHMIPTRMIQEHPLTLQEPEDKTSFFRIWGSGNKSTTDAANDDNDGVEVEGEGQPLLSSGKKKKKKWYGNLSPRKWLK